MEEPRLAGHMRGPDGYLPPYSDEKVAELVARNALQVAGHQVAMQALLALDRELCWYLLP